MLQVTVKVGGQRANWSVSLWLSHDQKLTILFLLRSYAMAERGEELTRNQLASLVLRQSLVAKCKGSPIPQNTSMATISPPQCAPS